MRLGENRPNPATRVGPPFKRTHYIPDIFNSRVRALFQSCHYPPAQWTISPPALVYYGPPLSTSFRECARSRFALTVNSLFAHVLFYSHKHYSVSQITLTLWSSCGKFATRDVRKLVAVRATACTANTYSAHVYTLTHHCLPPRSWILSSPRVAWTSTIAVRFPR